MADNEFANRAVALAVSDLEDNLIAASRQYEDAARCGDEITASFALKNYSAAQREYNELTGANQPQQQPGQLSVAQRNFLSRGAAGGDTLTTSDGMAGYTQWTRQAVDAGLTQDSPQYFGPFAVVRRPSRRWTNSGH